MLVDRYITKQLAYLPHSEQGGIQGVEAVKRLAGIQHILSLDSAPFEVGLPSVAQYFALQDQTLNTKQQVLQIAASLVRGMATPALQALTRAAQELNLPLREVEMDSSTSIVEGRIDRTWYLFGTAEAMHMEAVELGVSSQTIAQRLEDEGREVYYLAQKQPKRLLAVFAITSPLSLEAGTLVKELCSMGISVTLLSQQKNRVAKGVAKQLGIDLVHSELDTKELRSVLKMRQEGHPEIGILADASMVRLVPPHSSLMVRGDRVMEGALVQVAHIEELPAHIEAARTIIAQTKQRFFWARIY
jgi:hypothetical protein